MRELLNEEYALALLNIEKKEIVLIMVLFVIKYKIVYNKGKKSWNEVIRACNPKQERGEFTNCFFIVSINKDVCDLQSHYL
jgi:hypothetical protein